MESEQGREGVYCGMATHHGQVVSSWRTTDAISSAVRDAIRYDAERNVLTLTGEDVIRAGRRLGVYNDADVRRWKQRKRVPVAEEEDDEEKEREHSDEDAVAARTKDERESDERGDPDEDAVHHVATLADLNRVHRRKYGQRDIATHDLAHRPVITLADLNVINRHRHGRAA